MRYTESQLTSELLDQPEFAGEPLKVFICSSPRSGSYMLCRYMTNAGLGVPHEYFNPLVMRQIAPRFGLAAEASRLKWRAFGHRDRLPFRFPDRIAEQQFLARYIAALVPRRCQNGVFAAKIQLSHYLHILNNPVGHKLLGDSFFIYLFREDLLRQAVSHNFSYVTGRWGDDDAVTTAPVASGDLLDPAGIDRELKALADEDREWRLLMARNGLSPISISYEQLCKDPAGFVTAIASWLGIDPARLRQGYSEPIVAAGQDDPALPTKREVAERYLAAFQQIRGRAPDAGPPAASRAAAE